MMGWVSALALFAKFPPLCDRNTKNRRLQPKHDDTTRTRQWSMLLLIISLIATTTGICNINFNMDRNPAQLAGLQHRALDLGSSISSTSSSISLSFFVRFAVAEEYVRCGTGAASLCRADYPICCNGFCASAGTKCCPSASTCDPGEECCTNYDPVTRVPKPTCCKPGSYCGNRGCIEDTTCASITDIGVCVSQFVSQFVSNSSAEQNNKNSKDVSRCSWCCESQRCMPTSEASSRSICAYPISSPDERCPDPCNLFGSCDECTMSKSSSSSSSCLWDSSKQKCFSLGSSSYNPFAVVSSPSQCASVLFWGHGIYPSDGPMSIFEGSSKIFLIVFAVLFVTCLLAICVSGARVAILVNRTHMDWEAERETIAQSISAAVPRYGFGEDEGPTAPTSAAGTVPQKSKAAEEKNKKKKRAKKAKKSREALPCEKRLQEGLLSPTATPLLGREDSNDGDESSSTDDAAEGSEDDSDLCHLCSRPVKHDSRRRFIQVGCASLPSSNSSNSNNNATKKADAPSLGGGREEEAEGNKADEKNGLSPASNKIKDNGEQKPEDKDKASSKGPKKATSAEVVESWHQLILLPCYHRVCKRCILEMARQNAVTAAAKSEMDANSANGGRGLFTRFVFGLKRCAVAIVTRIDAFWSRVFDSLTTSVAGPAEPAPARRRRRRSRGGRDDYRQTSASTVSTHAALSGPSSSSTTTHRTVGSDAPAASLLSGSRGDTERINTSSLRVVEAENTNGTGWAGSGRGETCTSLHVMAMEEGRGAGGPSFARSSAIDTSRIKAVLDAPNVAEDALLAVMRGSTVEMYERAASAAKASALRREQRRRQRDSDRAHRRGTAAAAGAHEEDETSSASDDEESADEHMVGTHERSFSPHCPICSKNIELIFVPGKIIR